MARKKFTKAEKKQIRKEQRQKDALRSYRFRPLKNFLFWLTGVLSSFVILITALVVGLKFVPISVYTGGNNGEVFSKDITSKSIIDAFMKYDTYDMSDFPIITNSIKDLAESEDVKKFVKIDTSKLSSLKFDANFSTELASCVEVTATLDSMGGAEILSDLGNLDIFKKWDKVPFDEMPDVDAEGNMVKVEDKLINNPHLYYYKTFANEYFRAFNDNGKREQGAIDSDLYYPNLASIPLLEIMNVITDSFGRLSLNSLLTTFGAGDSFGDSLLGDILDGKTISDLENISGENILLVDILGDYNDDTKSMYDILCSIVKTEGEKPTYETLSVAHLQGGIDFEGLLISNFIDDDDTLDMLCSIVGGGVQPKDLSVSHLSNGINIENLKLSEFIDDEETLDMLCSIVGGDITADQLTVSHLTEELDFKNIKLSKFIDDADTLDMLCSIVGGDITADQLTVEHLSGELSFDNLKLDKFIDDEDTLDILCTIVGGDITADKLTVAHLRGELNFDNLKLSEFIDDEDTLDMLCTIVGGGITADQLKVSDLSGELNFDNLKLSEFIDDEGTLDMLCSIVGGDITADQLKVSDLSGELNFDNLKLSEFIDDEDTLDMLCSIVGGDITADQLTVEHLSGELNFDNLKLDKFIEDEDTLDMLCTIVGGDITADKLTVAHLSGELNFDNLKLDKFIDDEETLDMLCTIVGGDITTDKLTVAHLSGELSFDNLKLDKFIDDEETLDMLCTIVGGDITTDKLTVAHLSGELNFDNLKLDKFIDDEDTLNMLCTIVGGDITTDKLTVAHLSGELSFDNLKLDKFIEDEDTLDMLCKIIIVENGEDSLESEELTIGHLSNGFNFGDVVIAEILSQEGQTIDEQYQSNKTLYDVLCSAVGLGSGEENYANLKISHLQGGLAFTAVSLAVLNLDSDTLDILLKAVNASREEGEPALSKEDLTIEHINSDVFTYITLTDVLPFEGGENGNVQLYTIFLQASNVQITDPTNESEIEEKSQKLNINNLKNFDIDLVNLSTILPVSDNQNLYKILVDATGVPSEQIKVGDFSSFKLSEIHLKTFLKDASYNKIMQALIDSDCTVGSIGTKINELKLYDIYGSSCFVSHDQNVNTPKYKLNEETGTYTLSDDGTYMISKSAGIWLFLCFDTGEIEDGTNFPNAIGCAKTYKISQATMGQLQNQEEDNSGNDDPENGDSLTPDIGESTGSLSGLNISSKITAATIRQLIDAGILNSATQMFYTYRLTDLANLQFETGGFISGISH